MYTPEQIIEIMREHYIAASGLGRIDRDDTTILSDGVESCRNENGILFLAYMIARGIHAGVNLDQDIAKARKTVQTLEVRPGVFKRQPDGRYPREMHDNYVAVAFICVMSGDTLVPSQMVEWGWSNWFCYNDKDPGTFEKTQIRQPGEVALYYVAAERNPPMLFWLWFLVGLVINAKKKADAPQARLAWLRTVIIDRKLHKLGFVKRWLYKKALAYWTQKTEEKHGNLDAIWHFPEGHPVCLFRELGRNGE